MIDRQHDRIVFGCDACGRLHFRPIIYMTGDDNSALREAAHQSGCLVDLTKPFTARDNRTASNGTTRIPGAARQ